MIIFLKVESMSCNYAMINILLIYISNSKNKTGNRNLAPPPQHKMRLKETKDYQSSKFAVTDKLPHPKHLQQKEYN